MATWEPKYDFAVSPDEYSRTLKEDRGQHEDNRTPWVEAPPDSHIEAFRYFDNRTPQFELLDPSELQVRIKAKGNQPAKEYGYLFPDAAEGESVFEALCAADHPGEVVHAKLIKAGVTYFRRS